MRSHQISRRDLAGLFAGVVGTSANGNAYPKSDFPGDRSNASTIPAVHSRTEQERAIGIAPVDLRYLPGYVDRYAINTSPGETDMSEGLQAAINLALASAGAGIAGTPVRFLDASYLIGTPPTFGNPSLNIRPIDIGGAGLGSQIINNAPPDTKPTFDMSGVSGWRIHDLLLCGNSDHRNSGIRTNSIGGPQSMNWEIDSVLSLMPGHGIYIADTNTFRVRNFMAWPGNTSGLLRIPQSVNQSDINHHVYITGAFAHNGFLQDCNLCPNDRYFTGHRGLKLDCAASTGLSILNPLAESLSNLHTEIGIEIVPSGFAAAMTLWGAYSESAGIHLANVVNSVIGAVTDGGEGGSLKLLSGVRGNSIFGTNLSSIYCDGSSFGNIFSGVEARAIWLDRTEHGDSTAAPNQRIGCSIAGIPFASRGTAWRRTLAFADRIDSDTFGASSANIYVIRVTSGRSFEIKSPLNPCNGFAVTYTIRNESGGPMGAPVFSGFKASGFVNPRNGFNRSISFYYDSEFSQWRQQWVGTADVPN